MNAPQTKLPKIDKAVVALMRDYAAVRAQIKALEAQQDDLKAELMPYVLKAGGKVDHPLYRAYIVSQTRESLDRDALIEAGVTPRQMEKGTRRTEVSFVRVDVKKVAE